MLGLPFIKTSAAIGRRQPCAILRPHELDVVRTDSIALDELLLLLVPIQLTLFTLSNNLVACKVEGGTSSLL